VHLCSTAQTKLGFLRRLVVAVMLVLALLSGVCAQQTVTSGILRGRIEDAGGGGVGGASLTATNLETNQKQSATTDSEGRYRFP